MPHRTCSRRLLSRLVLGAIATVSITSAGRQKRHLRGICAFSLIRFHFCNKEMFSKPCLRHYKIRPQQFWFSEGSVRQAGDEFKYHFLDAFPLLDGINLQIRVQIGRHLEIDASHPARITGQAGKGDRRTRAAQARTRAACGKRSCRFGLHACILSKNQKKQNSKHQNIKVRSPVSGGFPGPGRAFRLPHHLLDRLPARSCLMRPCWGSSLVV